MCLPGRHTYIKINNWNLKISCTWECTLNFDEERICFKFLLQFKTCMCFYIIIQNSSKHFILGESKTITSDKMMIIIMIIIITIIIIIIIIIIIVIVIYLLTTFHKSF